ncbi:hypothetical protein EIP86_010207 [Pleurotus ostreatoroseus]|nr:hypothetical protein EIP86_010207 [Pleurotus ostreatoroseus]
MQRRLNEYTSPAPNTLLPTAALTQSIKFGRHPVASSTDSQTSDGIIEPKPTFIAMDAIRRAYNYGTCAHNK